MSRFGANRTVRILITGAGSGVGLACAHAFAERGADLIMCDSDGTALTRASESAGGFSRFCDVVSEASVAVFAAEVEAKFPSIDVLINAAGDGYVRTLGMMQMSRALLPLLRRGSGRRLIINVAPAGGLSAPGMFPYASSREGFQGLSDSLGDQTRGSMIEVVSVIPSLRLEPIARSTEAPFYRIEPIDEQGCARRIFELVVAARPDWRQREIRRSRRA